MKDGWQPNIKLKPQIDVNDPSFPWRDGKPSWSDYYANKRAEQEDREMRRYKGGHRPKSAMVDKCCFPDPNKTSQMCGHKSLGLLAIKVNGTDKLVPLCDKHRHEVTKAS